MPGPGDENDRPPKPPAGPDQPTTPYATPQPSETGAVLKATDIALRALQQRYDILAEIGRGGMGIVYRARDRETGAEVALKVLRPEIAADATVIERFKSELLLARKITHKNVCRIYDLHRFGETAAIAMEYVRGESLRHILARYSPLSARKGLEWTSQICDALREAHAQGVVHRDLKPENIVIDRDGNVKVMDFGIARSLETTTATAGAIVGTPAYMSPEQAEGKPADARSDIYSLGLILYEMFTGQHAFRADTPVAFALKQIHETAPPPRNVDPYLPAFIDRAIQKSLEKNPKDRFQTVEELETVLSGESPAEVAPEHEPRPREHLAVWGRRDWVLLVLGLAGLVYFLTFRDDVYPGSKTRLEIDAVTAQRQARDLFARLGRPVPDMPGFTDNLTARLDFEGLDLWRGNVGRPDPRDYLRLNWRVSSDWGERNVLLDSTGKVIELSCPAPQIPLDYQLPPIEQRRQVAQALVEQVCGPTPRDFTRTETLGGNLGASYNVTWISRVLGFPMRKISLVAEKVTEVKCGRPSTRFMWWDLTPEILQVVSGLVLLVILTAVVVYFGVDRSYRSPIVWKRVPIAALLGFSGAWLAIPAFFASPPPLFVMLAVSLEASAVFLVALVAIEQRLRRFTPGWIGTYTIALRGKLLEPALGLAVIRGVLAGLAFAGLETLAAYLSIVSSGRFPGATTVEEVYYQELFTFMIDNGAAGQAAVSASPALSVVLSALFHGFVLGFLIPGFVLVAMHKAFLRLQQTSAKASSRLETQLKLILAVTFAVFASVFGLRLHFGATIGAGLSMACAWVPLLLGACLGWLVLTFDIMTVIVGVATYVLWTINYPLLGILEVIGNSPEWGIFIGWGVLVLAGALVGFSPRLLRAWHGLRADSA